MFKRFIISPPVFFGAVAAIGIFLAVGVVLPERAGEVFKALQAAILNSFGWLYPLAVGIFLATVLLLCLGRYGRLKLGPDEATPTSSSSPGSPCCSPPAWASASCSTPWASR
jgi:choline/glycine/proline betaine transport protein